MGLQGPVVHSVARHHARPSILSQHVGCKASLPCAPVKTVTHRQHAEVA